MLKKILNSTLLLLTLTLLSGCWESTNVTFHQPGQYMGASDNLKTDSAALQQRFGNQQDR